MIKPLRAITGALACLLLAACASEMRPEPPPDPPIWTSDVDQRAITSGEVPTDSLEPAISEVRSTQTEFFPNAPSLTAPPHSITQTAVSDGERYELNFNNADVRAVIDAILGDMLEIDYVVAPAVQGQITFRTSRPIAKTALLTSLEAALASVSAAIVKRDQVVHVVPMSEAPLHFGAASRAQVNAPRLPGYAIEIVPLRFINADEMKAILDSFVPRGTVLQADNTHGHLVIAGSSQDRAAVLKTVASFDTDWLEGMRFALFHLANRPPKTVTTELNDIFQGKLDLFTSRVRIIPLDQIQAILGVARRQEDLTLLEEWITRLDVSRAGTQRMFVYNVQNGRASDLVTALRQVLTGEAAPAATSSSDTVTPMGFQPLADSTTDTQLEANIGRLVALEENNSLLFYGTAQEYQVIQDALREIDVLPRQVMIEAVLAEVTLTDELRYGVQWFFDVGENTVTLSAADSGSVGSQFPGFSYVYSGSADARVVLNALQSKTTVKILSAPKIVVLNNQKASLQVGDQVPIVTRTSQSTNAGESPVISTIEMRDTGVILEVTPRVNDNGNVILDVMQEVSEVAKTTSSGIDSPTIQTRKLHSVVATRNGFTVALGGLIRESGSDGNSGVPIVKDLPIVGNLFKSSTFDTRRTELVILLVPHVMRNQMETQAVVNALTEGLQSATGIADHAPPLEPKPSN